MRTKALLLGAMIGAASLATSMAQVYSVNIVGYVNLTIPTGFSIIQNPLNASPDNTVKTVIPAPPNGILLYKYNGTGYDIVSYDTDFGEWDKPNTVIDPGQGFFIYNSGAPFTVTFVGEVATGPTSIPLVSGFNMIGSKVPQAGRLQSDLGYTPAATGETTYQYVNGSGYIIRAYDGDFGEWDTEPVLAVGEGFWAYRTAGGSWDRNFSVGP